MSRRKRPLNANVGRTPARRGRPHGRTRALAAVLTLAAAGIAATAWLTNAQEPTRVTTTVNAAQPAQPQPATPSPQAQPSTTMTPAPSTTTAAAATQPVTQQPSAPAAAGQRAFIDPATGELRQPEHDEFAAIAAAAAAAAPVRRLARTTNAAQESFGADGSIEAVVPEDLHTFTVATRGPDGRITIEHAQGAKDAVKVMNAKTAKKGTYASVSRAQAKEDRNDR